MEIIRIYHILTGEDHVNEGLEKWKHLNDDRKALLFRLLTETSADLIKQSKDHPGNSFEQQKKERRIAATRELLQLILSEIKDENVFLSLKPIIEMKQMMPTMNTG